MRALRHFFRRRMLAPFLLADVPPGQVSRGAGIGLFVALLPIVGQLYLTPAVWAGLRALPRLRFNLPTALAMVALISPPSKVPLFYGYIVTGDAVLHALDSAYIADSSAFRAQMAAMADAPWHEWFAQTGRLTGLALERYGLPLAVGGIAWAVVLGVTVGVGTAWVLTRRGRRRENGGRAAN
jgi:uncharacterized protein (DUF2062 family)